MCHYKAIIKCNSSPLESSSFFVAFRSSASKVINNTAISSQNANNQSSEVFQFDPGNYYPKRQSRSLSLVPMGSLFDEQRANCPMGKKRQIEKDQNDEVKL